MCEYKDFKWTDVTTSLRTKDKHDFEKDYFKLVNNSEPNFKR